MKKLNIEKTVDQIVEEASWLFSRRNIDGLFPVLYLSYSFNNGLKTCLDEGWGADAVADPLQDKLYWASLGTFGGDRALFNKLSDTYALMRKLGRSTFNKAYRVIVERYLCYTDLIAGTALLPNQRIAHTIFNILKEKGCESVYAAYSGVGSFIIESQNMAFRGAEPCGAANIIAEVLADVYEVKDYSLECADPLAQWPDTKVDAVIGNLPVDADFFNIFRYEHFCSAFNKKQDRFLNKLISNRTATKAAAVLVHFEFANKREFDKTRKLICKEGLLDTVIALPEDIFSNTTVPTYLVILDMTGSRKEATFIDGRVIRPSYYYTMKANRIDLREDAWKNPEKTITVSYDQMQSASWAFNPAVYLQDAVCPEGMELVRIGDVASIPFGQRESGPSFDPTFLSGSIKTVLGGIKPSSNKNQWSGACMPVDGPGVMLALSRGARRQEQNLVCGLCKDEGFFRTDFYVMSLKPDKDKILPEYLALALMSDTSFAEYYKNIQQYYTDDVRYSHVLERRIPIYTDLLMQRKAVWEALGRADAEETVFNVVMAGFGSKLNHFARLFTQLNCNILDTTETVEGKGGLEDILSEATQPGVSLTQKVDAVVFDANIPLSKAKGNRPYSGMDAIADLQLLYGTKDIVFYAASNAGIEDVESAGILSERRLRYFREGRFFKNENGLPVRSMAIALRKELDIRESNEARIRTRNKKVFEAADWIDANFSGARVSEVLSDFLIAKDFGKDSARNLTDMRIVAHHMIDILKEWKIVPDDPNLNHGAIPKLIYEQKYKTPAQTTYIFWDDNVMPKPLSSSLLALIEIGNEGSHTFNARPLLGASMLNTLMEFVLWLYESRHLLSGRTTPPWFKENEGETVRIDNLPLTGRVRKVAVKNGPIWACENVHLQNPVDGDIREGDIVTILRVVKETKYMSPDITVFAYNDCYIIDKSARS